MANHSETLQDRTAFARNQRLRKVSSPRPVSDTHVFQLNLETILSAHFFGHIDEASTLRAISRTIEECLLGDPEKRRGGLF